MRAKKVLLSLCLLAFSTSCFSALTDERVKKALDAQEAMLSKESAVVNDDNATKKADQRNSFKKNDDDYYDVVTYNLLIQERKQLSMAPQTASREESFLSDNRKRLQEKIDKIAVENETKKEENLIFTLSGYCNVRNLIEIEEMQGYGLMDCEFEEYEHNGVDISSATVFANFIPIPDKYALIAKPIYIMHKGTKIPIKDGVFLTVDQTSLNVANFVNDRKLKRLLSDMAIQTNQLALASATDYMAQKRASERVEELAYSTSTGGAQVVSSTSVEKPRTEDYLVNFGVQLVSGIIGAFGEHSKADSYPLFKVYKNTQLYADLIVEKRGSSQQPINYQQDSHQQLKKQEQESGFKINLDNLQNSINPNVTR